MLLLQNQKGSNKFLFQVNRLLAFQRYHLYHSTTAETLPNEACDGETQLLLYTDRMKRMEINFALLSN